MNSITFEKTKCSDCNGAGSNQNHEIGGWTLCPTCGGIAFNYKHGGMMHGPRT